jgi:cellulose synthase (UDP-forming)
MLNTTEFIAPVFGLLLLAGGLLLTCQLLDPKNTAHRALFGGVTIMICFAYLGWRWSQTLDFAPLTSFAVLWPLLFALAETSRYLEQCQAIFTLRNFTDRTREADIGEARLRAMPSELPAVDVFIPTLGEPEPVIRRTIIGAKALDYPSLRIFVLDDGARPWLAELCDRLGVHYIPRVGGEHAKAGNLNHGLAMTRDLDPAPFILSLDADFVPYRNFLWRTLGFFDDPRVGLVQTPQFYFNPDPVQLNLGTPWSIGDEQRFFFDVFQPAKDAADVAFCCGSCCVWRRAAIEGIGGVPTGAIVEDIHLSFRLLADGWITRYLNEILANGLSAESTGEFVGQRVRWAVGCAQSVFMRCGPFARNGLTLSQRVHYLSTVLYWINLVFIPLQVLAPAVYWLSGVPVLNCGMEGWLYYLIPCIMLRSAFMFWVSQGTFIPFWKTLQLVYAADTTFSLATLFTTRRIRARRATTKGLGAGDRAADRRLLAILAIYLVANVAGLWWGLLSNLSVATDFDANQVNTFWALYAILCTLIAMTLCVEVPRLRHDERFHLTEPVEIADVGSGTLLDISVHGARLAAPQTPELIHLRWRQLPPIFARRLRQQADTASYRFEIDEETARQLTVEIFTSGLRATAERVRIATLFHNVACRFILHRGAGR